MSRELETWDCCVDERDAEGKHHFWNMTVQAYDALDAVNQCASSHDASRVDGIEVERRSATY